MPGVNAVSGLSDLFRSGKPATGAPRSAADDAGPRADTEAKGQDARRLAELKAEEAGRKWRAEAEARGEIRREIGGPKGLEPTRYGDWEKAGRCVDF